MFRRYIRSLAFLLTLILSAVFLYKWISQRATDQTTGEASRWTISDSVVDSAQEQNLAVLGLQDRAWRAKDNSEKKKSQTVGQLGLSDKQQHTNAVGDEMTEGIFKPLPPSVINSVERFLFFVGYARSGHSIIASMLDAHPHIVIAHEYSLFLNWNQNAACHRNKACLFNALYNNSWTSVNSGWRREQALKKGYTLSIPGWWQGGYNQSIVIIGDKSGGMTAQVYRKSHKDFSSLYRTLKETVRLPVSVIHVVRNPYDNIATMLLYNMRIKKFVNETHKYVNYHALRDQINAYFSQVASVMEMADKLHFDVIEVHNSDFISNPIAVMRGICLQLHIFCSEEYLSMCAEKTFKTESHSRHLVKWWPDLINLAARKMEEYEHLKRYASFDL